MGLEYLYLIVMYPSFIKILNSHLGSPWGRLSLLSINNDKIRLRTDLTFYPQMYPNNPNKYYHKKFHINGFIQLGIK